MTAKKLINRDIPTLKSSDNVDKALQIMSEDRMFILPCVAEDTLIGFFSEELLLNFDYDTLLKDIAPILEDVRVSEEVPELDVVRSFMMSEIEILPVFDLNKKYLGVIEKNQLLSDFIKKMNLHLVGGIIELNVSKKEYSLTEIARIVEQENAHIISLFFNENEEDGSESLILKLDTTQISAILQSLTRFGYEVEAYQSSEPVANLEKDRYDLLMKYLSI
jgi:acetoin utilization protein AcuB